MDQKRIDEIAGHLSDTFMDTAGRLAEEHGLTTSQYVQAKAYHSHLKEYPFELVVQAMRENGMFRSSC